MLGFVAVCRMVLQCAAVCQQYAAVCQQCVAVCCSVLQCVAVYCSVLQCVAVYCIILLRTHSRQDALVVLLPRRRHQRAAQRRPCDRQRRRCSRLLQPAHRLCHLMTFLENSAL